MTIYLHRAGARSAILLSAVSTSILTTPLAFAQTEHRHEPLDEIIVTGSPLSATTGESLVGVSVIGGEQLANNLAGSLGETLKKTPGLSSTFFGPGASRPIIRGQGGDRIRILDNGIGAIDASSASPDHATSVEPAMASRIEIIRGSGLLRYGSSASGGVINVIDGRIPDRVSDQAVTGAARIGGSSVDSGYEGSVGADLRLGEIGSGTLMGHVDASARKTRDYNIPGFAESALLRAEEEEEHDDHDEEEEHEEEARNILGNSATKSRAFSGGLSWIGDNAIVGFAVRNLDSTYGIPGGHDHEHEEEHNDDDHDDHDEEEDEGGVTVALDQTRFDALAQITMNGLFETLTLNGGYADYEHREIEPEGAVGTVFTNQGFELRGEVVQAKRGDWHAAYGTQYRQRDFTAIGEEAFVPKTRSKQWGLFTFQELDLNKWHLEAGVRYEHNAHNNKADNLSRSFDSFSSSGGVDFHISDTTRLGGTVFATSRAPTTEELFSNGPHLATRQYEIGDINLGQEKARGGEISLRYKTGNTHADTHASINIFATDYSDYIYERLTGDEQDDLTETQFTAADATFKGFEIEAGMRLGTLKSFDILVDGSVEYVEAKLKRSDTALPRIPPLGLGLAVMVENETWYLRAELDHTAKQDELAQGERLSESYSLVNFQASYRINERVTVRGSLNNIFDTEARQHTSFLKDEVPLPGRNLKLSLSAKF